MKCRDEISKEASDYYPEQYNTIGKLLPVFVFVFNFASAVVVVVVVVYFLLLSLSVKSSYSYLASLSLKLQYKAFMRIKTHCL